MPRFSVRELVFPLGGLNENFGYQFQPPYTTVDAKNVQGYEPATGRARGGQRPGLSLYATLAASGRVQDMISFAVGAGYSTGGSVIGARTITALAVRAGNIQTFTGGTVATPTGGSSALSSTAPFVFSAEAFGDVFFVDGANYKRYSGGSVSTWTPSSGTLPISGSDTARLIELWRGRLMLSGLVGDDHNWFATCLGDPYDIDYSPEYLAGTTAIAGNNAPCGKVGDKVNAMLPYNDDRLIFGCDSSLWLMDGDPGMSGTLNRISHATGMAWGRPYCVDPSGVIYFFGSRGGVYRMVAGGIPESITDSTMEKRLRDVDLDTTVVRMAWDGVSKCLLLFLTPLTVGETTHYRWDARNNAWWPMVFANNTHNPIAVYTLDGDDPGDRVTLIGTSDGKILKFDEDADDDNGTGIDSYVMIGPIRLGGMRMGVLHEMQAILGENSDDVEFSVHVGRTAEEAAAADPYFSGTWSAGRNLSERRRAMGEAMFLKLRRANSHSRWSAEAVAVKVREAGMARQRGLP